MSHPANAVRAERRAIDELLAQRAPFHAFLVRRVRDRALADDLLQDADARAVGQVETLRNGSAAAGWFYALLRNAVTDHHRRVRTREKALAAVAREPLDIAESDAIGEPRACRCVARLARALDPSSAQALTRIEVDGLPRARARGRRRRAPPTTPRSACSAPARPCDGRSSRRAAPARPRAAATAIVYILRLAVLLGPSPESAPPRSRSSFPDARKNP